MKKKIIVISVTVLVVAVLAVMVMPKPTINNYANFEGTATVYKSITCGCCDSYAKVLDSKGFDVETVSLQDTGDTKNQFGIPSDMESCHTTIIGDYFIEGHVPFEAVSKLLEEKPNIKGIALPGMPSGSPGMPGAKKGSWDIYAIGYNGATSVFMTL